MRYWLIKSEPNVFCYDDLIAKGQEHWDGVRNYTARNNMRTMKIGDKAFFYHSNIGKEIVGIVKIIKEAYQDPTTADTQWICVDVAPVKKLKNPVRLVDIKANPNLCNMKLVKQSRLSVSDVTKEEFEEILNMSK